MTLYSESELAVVDAKDGGSGLPEQITSYLGAAQTALALAGAAGLTALARNLWTKARLGDDEKFLAALASHEAATDRVEKIREAAVAKEAKPQIGKQNPSSSSSTPERMRELADALEERSEINLQYAIARGAWAQSRQRRIGKGTLLCSPALLFLAGCSYVSSPLPDCFGLIVSILGILFGFIGLSFLVLWKDTWLENEVKRKRHRIHWHDKRW